MNTDEIKVGHCYSMMPIKGRHTIARVTKRFNISAMAADEYLGGKESLVLNPTVVQFIWRHASYQSGWSKKQQLLLIDEFASAAETEVACSQ